MTQHEIMMVISASARTSSGAYGAFSVAVAQPAQAKIAYTNKRFHRPLSN